MIAVQHVSLAAFIRAYRHEPSKSPVYQKNQIHVEEENLERKVVEEKRTKKFYYAVRASSDFDITPGSKTKINQPYAAVDLNSNDIALDILSESEYPSYSRSKFRDRGQGDVIFQGRNARNKYESDFSDLPFRRSTTVSPYLTIRPEALHENDVPEDHAEQATQLYETFQKPKKGFRPSPLLDFTDTSIATNFVPSHDSMRFSSDTYSSSKSSSPVIFHNEIHGPGGRKSLDTTYNAVNSPTLQHSLYSSYVSTNNQPEKGHPRSVFHNSIHTSNPVNDYLQLELLKALRDNKALLQHQRQQEQPSNFLSYLQQAQRMVPQPVPMRSPALRTPLANTRTHFNYFRRYPFMQRRDGEKPTNFASQSDWQPVSSAHHRRVKRSPFIPLGKQQSPISFSIPILPSKPNISVPTYATVETELVNVGDFDNTDYVFDKLLSRDFPVSHPLWMHESNLPNIFGETSGRLNASEHNFQENRPPGDSNPNPPLEALGSTIQQTSEALSFKEGGKGHEQPIRFALNPAKNTENEEKTTRRPNLDNIEEFQQHSDPNGSYSVWYVTVGIG